MKMKLELVPVPVADVDPAQDFYVDQAGFHADVDVRPNDAVRIVQLTPPGPACPIVLVTGVPSLDMSPGSLRGLHLIVGDVASARGDHRAWRGDGRHRGTRSGRQVRRLQRP